MRLCLFTIVAAAVVASLVVLHGQEPLSARVFVSGLTSPVAFVQDPTDRTLQFVVEQGGRIRVIKNGVLGGDFLDLSGAIVVGAEQGLLGLAFAPDTATSGRFFVNFTNRDGNTVVARFKRATSGSSSPLPADPASRFDLRWPDGNRFIFQPYVNHNGGNLVFGPDGYLYIGMGDGGSAGDPDNRAQNGGQLLGKMLRIDVNVPDSDSAGYRAPPDNPFVSGGPVPALGEIWAFGMRNPWRYSFDDPARGGTGALVIGDVGQAKYEEIDYEPRGKGGRNYGWRVREALHLNDSSRPPAYLPLTDPIFEYDHSVGLAITGGFVYRGRALGASYQGRYFFADYVNGRLWSLGLNVDPASGEATAGSLAEHTDEAAPNSIGGTISSFGLDSQGELYIVVYTNNNPPPGGSILKVLGPPLAPQTPTGFHIIR